MDNQKTIFLIVGVLVIGLLLGSFISGQAVRKLKIGGGGGGGSTTISTSIITSTSTTTTIASAIMVTFRQGEGGYSGSNDAYLYQINPNTNYANRAALGLMRSTTGSSYFTLVKYDISSIPSTATINSVDLMETTFALCCNNPGTTVGVYEMTNTGVTVASATWNTKDGSASWASGAFSPSDYNPSVLAQGTYPTGGALKFNISGASLTSYVQSRLGAGAIWLVLANDGTQNQLNDMNSNEVSVITNRPKLFVTYKNNFILGPGEYNMTLPGWANRDYKLYIPRNYDKIRPMPVMLVLHGGGGNGWVLYSITCPDGDSTNSKCMNNIAEREGFIVAYPNGVEGPFVDEVRTWNGGGGKDGYTCVSGYACENNFDDIGYFNALLDDIEKKVNVDKNRVYATGISNGAAMSHRLACQLSDRITAIAPIAFGNQYSANANCNPSRSVPVVEFHGTNDPYATYNGGQGHDYLGEENGLVVGAPQSAADWAKRNGCTSNATQEMPDSSNDGTTVTKISYYGCKNDGDVVLYRINDGGHTWPDGQSYATAWYIGKTTRDINANELMWEFFRRYSL